MRRRFDHVLMTSVFGEPLQPRTWSGAPYNLAGALKRRGVAAKVETTVSDGTPVADIMLSTAADLTADLIVMGAWAHSRLREFVLGGASRGIMQEMTVPVLMSH